ncbi:MAG: SIS domain-containing protein [Chlamydiales bacterium]|nr:SIS domain-containing protein [Chlamydiales bacterium]
MFLERIEELKGCIETCSYTDREGEISAQDALFEAQKQIQSGNIFVIGNGGSAGIASHFCTDLLKTLELPASSFSDSNILTCFGNDYGYENVFSSGLRVRMTSEDLLVAISSSGKSENILRACHVAKEKGGRVITLSGFLANNPLRQLGDLNFWVDSCDYGLVETAHFFLLHTVIDSLSSCKRRSEELMKLAH